jgi:hypothetical protein
MKDVTLSFSRAVEVRLETSRIGSVTVTPILAAFRRAAFFESGQVEIVDADLRGHQFVEERAEWDAPEKLQGAERS